MQVLKNKTADNLCISETCVPWNLDFEKLYIDQISDHELKKLFLNPDYRPELRLNTQPNTMTQLYCTIDKAKVVNIVDFCSTFLQNYIYIYIYIYTFSRITC